MLASPIFRVVAGVGLASIDWLEHGFSITLAQSSRASVPDGRRVRPNRRQDMTQRHSEPLRGLTSAKSSPLFQGRFGRMFRSLRPASFGANDADVAMRLAKLGAAMSSDFDPPLAGKDDEESGIPALYTYFGQFIDHDLTFDPASSLQKQNDPDALTDYRSPAFDLDNVYGRGPDDQPYLYDGAPVPSFILGTPLSGGDTGACDLQRNQATPARALIGDPRNDENSIVSQLQGLFLRFHNRMVADHPGADFADIQQRVRHHYQYVVLHDFLPRIVSASVLDDLKSNGCYAQSRLRYFHWKHDPFMPVEFSVAAYRLGHSMVRPGYSLNPNVLVPIFPVADKGFAVGLSGFKAMNPAWGIDWSGFIDLTIRSYDGTDADKKQRLQFAYKLDTSLVNPLGMLPSSVASDPPASLASRNLLRGWRLGLPSGQAVACAMGLPVLSDDKILIGKAVEGETKQRIVDIDPVFAGNCPLWTYILAEAMDNVIQVSLPVKEAVTVSTPQLGPVGGRIVAEVFLGLLFGDKQSLLTLAPAWVPESGPDYGLKDFVAYALGK